MSKKHELKILIPFADAISRGEKTFEVRKNDRNFEVGDIVEFTALNTETLNPEAHPINGRQYKVGYVLRFEDFPAGLQEGFAVFTITPEPQEWHEVRDEYSEYYECPLCYAGVGVGEAGGDPEEWGWHYCPECGARLDGVKRIPDWQDEEEDEIDEEIICRAFEQMDTDDEEEAEA